jgi:predicted enzyme related to lactoylglutathione lyase
MPHRGLHRRFGEAGLGRDRLQAGTPDGHEDRIGGFFNGAFACDDVEATHRQRSGRGVQFDGPPQKQPWGTFATFRDPDGNAFVLSSR